MTHDARYGIDQALELLRQMPSDGDNDRLLIAIIRRTLESTGIDIDVLLIEAVKRQDEVTSEIVRVQGEIASLHQQIEEKTILVREYQESLAEIGSLRERFE